MSLLRLFGYLTFIFQGDFLARRDEFLFARSVNGAYRCQQLSLTYNCEKNVLFCFVFQSVKTE